DKKLEEMPVYGTIASQFNDEGTNTLFVAFLETIQKKFGGEWSTKLKKSDKVVKKNVIIPNNRRHYLREIADTVRNYHKHVDEQVRIARRLFQVNGTLEELKK